MIVRKTNSQRVPPCSAREPRPVTSTTGRGNSHKVTRHYRLIVAETYHDFSDGLPDQPGVIALVGINGCVEPFQFISFHHVQPDSQGS